MKLFAESTRELVMLIASDHIALQKTGGIVTRYTDEQLDGIINDVSTDERLTRSSCVTLARITVEQMARQVGHSAVADNCSWLNQRAGVLYSVTNWIELDNKRLSVIEGA